ncbi:hypothetical protein C4588_06135 [Candidatus Parcubacteria bacterium]|jgi:hypothetical protein|nr:MAG: hypothetical protein C4588_06135 [Candidatus Parcubacteria bacterium]
MAFGNDYGSETGIGMAKECKPDYEKMAAEENKRLGKTTALLEAMFDFAEVNGTHDFRQISSFAEMLGGVTLIMKRQEKRCAELLSQIEKQ